MGKLGDDLALLSRPPGGSGALGAGGLVAIPRAPGFGGDTPGPPAAPAPLLGPAGALSLGDVRMRFSAEANGAEPERACFPSA